MLRSLRRYRADNPYSHTLLFFFLDAAFGLLKIVLVGVVLASVWLIGNAWMKTSKHSPENTAMVVDEVEQQSAAIVIAEIESASVDPERAATLDQQIDQSPKKEEPVVALFDEKWVLSQSRDSFTMQLGSSPDRDKLVDFANEVLVDEQAHIYAFKVSSIGNPIYGLAYGLYPDLKSAQESIEKLPSSYREFNPWVRPISELQNQISQVKKKLAL